MSEKTHRLKIDKAVAQREAEGRCANNEPAGVRLPLAQLGALPLYYHGSPALFKQFSLDKSGESTGIKFGYGVYLTEVEASAAHYSQPRNMEPTPEHYLYTVAIPPLTEDNHLVSARPVDTSIVDRVEKELNVKIPAEITNAGKDFRKYVGCLLTGGKKAGFAEEQRAAEFFDSIGVFYNVWPTAQTVPDGPKNICVFNPDHIAIIKTESIEIELKCKKWKLVSRKEIRR
jgi:hypothetical protein